MTIGAYGLSAQALVSLAFLQCGTQGVLITLLVNFLASKSDHQIWFKVYVVLANTLTVGQTVIHVIQAFGAISNLTPVNRALELLVPVLTGLIGALVQAFYIYRCWRIYQQRILAIIPLLLLWIATLVSAIMMGGRIAQTLDRALDETTSGFSISRELWSFSSLAFDTITTFSTFVYFFYIELNAHHGILVVIWRILWASATPPLALVAISIIDEYAVPSGSGVVGDVAIGMMGKVYVLSIMINIVGRQYIRERFERRWATPSPPKKAWLRKQTNQDSDLPVVHITVHTEETEFTTGTRSISKNAGRDEFVTDNPNRDLSDGGCPTYA
ncbi:unnamed protein product [Rhizoctonia solani]|uniref:Uncharacterized protein n=1 Tax=Rhizoctonia solani TaxID=456999 RepID=A0A8H3HJW7_9AGAM|nr:unnamed protein product [Rhizoctonia solani]